MRKKIIFLDGFAGIGGFHRAIHKVAITKKYNFEVRYVTEVDKGAVKTYQYNFGANKLPDSGRDGKFDKNLQILSEDERPHGFLTAGFPCQSGSQAGHRRFFEDERGELLDDILQIIYHERPKFVLLENVPGFLSAENGEIYKSTLTYLKQCGYIFPKKPLILSPHEIGIPLHRPRLFIPAIGRGRKKPVEFNLQFKKIEFKGKEGENLKVKIVENQYVTAMEFWENLRIHAGNDNFPSVLWYDEFKQNYDLSSFPKGKQYIVQSCRDFYKKYKSYIDKATDVYKVDGGKKTLKKYQFNARHNEDCCQLMRRFLMIRQSGIRAACGKLFPTFTTLHSQRPGFYDKNHGWRYITAEEMVVLQGLGEQPHPDFHINYGPFSFAKNQPDAEKFKQIGNSVNVFLVEQIISQMLEFAEKLENKNDNKNQN